MRAGREGEREIVERAIEIERRRDFLVRHPEGAVGAIVRQRRAGARLKDNLRRQHDSGDSEFLAPTVEQQREVVAGMELVGFRKRFAHEHLAAAARREPASRAQEEAVQLRRAEIRQRTHLAAGRFVEARQIERDLHRDAGLRRSHAGHFRQLRREGVRGALQMRKHFGEAMRLVIFLPRAFQRKDQAARHDQHRQAAGHDERDRDHLTLHPVQVAQQLAIKVREHHQFKLLAGARWALRCW